MPSGAFLLFLFIKVSLKLASSYIQDTFAQ